MTLFASSSPSSPRARHQGPEFRPDRHAATMSLWLDANALTAQQIPPTAPNEAPLPTPGPEMPEPLPPIKPPPSENPVPVKEPPTVTPPMACGSGREQHA